MSSIQFMMNEQYYFLKTSTSKPRSSSLDLVSSHKAAIFSIVIIGMQQTVTGRKKFCGLLTGCQANSKVHIYACKTIQSTICFVSAQKLFNLSRLSRRNALNIKTLYTLFWFSCKNGPQTALPACIDIPQGKCCSFTWIPKVCLLIFLRLQNNVTCNTCKFIEPKHERNGTKELNKILPQNDKLSSSASKYTAIHLLQKTIFTILKSHKIFVPCEFF